MDEYFEGRAAQCRRLAQGVGDARTVQQLTEMALEFDAKARQASMEEDPPGPNSPEGHEA